MTREQRLELLKQIEKDIYVPSIESTLLEDAKSCAIHSAIEELEQETVSKESYDHEYFLRKEFEIKIAKLEHDKNKVLDRIDEIITDALDKSTDQKESQTLRWVLDKISENG